MMCNWIVLALWLTSAVAYGELNWQRIPAEEMKTNVATPDALKTQAGGLLIAGDYGIDLLSFDTLNIRRISATRATGIAFDKKTNQVLFTDWNGVNRINLDGTNSELLLPVKTPSGLTLDETTDKIYFSTKLGNTIEQCKKDMTNCSSLFAGTSLVDYPSDVSIDSKDGYIYWTNTGFSTGSISKGKTTGENSTILVSDLTFPTGIRFDPDSGRVFWVDYALQTINTMNQNGTDQQVLLELYPSEPFAIEIVGENLYIGTNEGVVFSTNKYTGDEINAVFNSSAYINYIGSF